MPKKYAEVLAAVNNMPEAKRKAEEDAAITAKLMGVEDFKGGLVLCQDLDQSKMRFFSS